MSIDVGSSSMVICPEAILGRNDSDGKLIYDADKLVNWMVKNKNLTYDQADELLSQESFWKYVGQDKPITVIEYSFDI